MVGRSADRHRAARHRGSGSAHGARAGTAGCDSPRSGSVGSTARIGSRQSQRDRCPRVRCAGGCRAIARPLRRRDQRARYPRRDRSDGRTTASRRGGPAARSCERISTACRPPTFLTGGDDGRVVHVPGTGEPTVLAHVPGAWIDALACSRAGVRAFGPIGAWMCPRQTFRFTSSTAVKPLNSLVRPRVSRMVSLLIASLIDRSSAARASRRTRAALRGSPRSPRCAGATIGTGPAAARRRGHRPGARCAGFRARQPARCA
jgi:hypothetical protein